VNQSINQFKIDKEKHVIEIASNDGYLLQHFKKKDIPILGIEPAKNIASYAESKGIPTINKFFGVDTAQELVQNDQKADFLIAFNVMPHVPNLNDFVNGLKMLLNPDGILIIQFSAYLLKLIELNEFDMIYHEHFSYFSLGTLKKIFSELKLKIFDVEELSIHGGSLRLYIIHEENNSYQKSTRVDQLLEKEKQFGLLETSTYDNFTKNIQNVKQDICNFFVEARKENKKIVCYGAPAKGNTLLNFCGIGKDFIEYTVDKNPHKQELFLPGTHIPIYSPEKVLSTKPDYLLILPWNLKDEIIEEMNFIRDWNGKFVVLIPKIEIIN
jgi:SAM-dependent methyltransferase